MSGLLNNPVTVGIVIGSVFCLFVFQVLLLIRIRTILQQVAFYIESISRFFYRVGFASDSGQKSPRIPHTCQFCKHRLSFIHINENQGEVEDFYYKCQIRNIEISLDETCEQYDKDDRY